MPLFSNVSVLIVFRMPLFSNVSVMIVLSVYCMLFYNHVSTTTLFPIGWLFDLLFLLTSGLGETFIDFLTLIIFIYAYIINFVI